MASSFDGADLMKKMSLILIGLFILAPVVAAVVAWQAGVRWIGAPIHQFYVPDRVKALMGEALSPIEPEPEAIRVLDERESEFLRNHPELLERKGNVLRITFPGQPSQEREDCVVGCFSDEFVLFRVEQVSEDPRSVLLLVERSEYTSYEVLFPSGDFVEISAPPRWSPDRKRLVDVETNEMWSVYRVELWELGETGPRKVFETGPAFATFVAFLGWEDDNRVKLAVGEDYFTREGSELCRHAELRLVEGEWQIVDAGQDPIPCPGVEAEQ